ncbi:hypothetical protein [Microbulbifer variabilis]|uniref:hypothetical protein n=1 Tax=Microbulbifer variabilis TaxID=266805 RepID=UPI001CFD52FA|nr:hypothetical protein [Microbulbifer variabilis]
MNRSTLINCIILGLIFVLSAGIFLIIRLILHWDAETTDSLLKHLSLVGLFCASTVFICLVAYGIYSIFCARRRHLRKLLVIGHAQPGAEVINRILKNDSSFELLEPISIPDDFIGNVLQKTKWQIQRLRGSWFMPSPKLLITFNVGYLNEMNEENIKRHLHDVISLISDVSPLGRKVEVYTLIHNFDFLNKFEEVEKILLDKDGIFCFSDKYDIERKVYSSIHELLIRLPYFSSKLFVELLSFSSFIKEEFENPLETIDMFESLFLPSKKIYLTF